MLPSSLVLGVLLGLQRFIELGDFLFVAAFFVRFYFLLVTVTVLPVLIFSLITSTSLLSKAKRLLPVLGKIVLMLLIFLLICLVLALLFYTLFSVFFPLQSDDVRNIISQSGEVEHAFTLAESAEESDSFIDNIQRFILSIIPKNIYQSLITEQLPALIFFSLFLGIILSILRYKNVAVLSNIIRSLYDSFQEIFHWLMYFLPLALMLTTANYIHRYSFEILRPVVFFIAIFGGVLLVSVIFTIIVLMRRQRCSFLVVGRQVFNVAILGLSVNNRLLAIPEAMRIFNPPEKSESIESGTIVAVLFSLNNIGYFLFLNIFSFIAMHVGGVAITPVSIAILLFASFIVSLTSGNISNSAELNNEASLFYSIMSFAGVVAHFSHGFWLVIYQLSRPLQVVYSVVVNLLISALVLPMRAQSEQEVLDTTEETEEDFDFNNIQFPDDEEAEEGIIEGIEEDTEPAPIAAAVGDAAAAEQVVPVEETQKEKEEQKNTQFFAIPFRLSVLILTTFLIITYGFLSTAISYTGSKVSLYSLADTFLDDLTQHSTEKISDYLDKPLTTLKSIRVFINEKGMFEKKEEIVPFLKGLLEYNTSFVSLYFGYNDGSFRMYKRMQDGSYSIRQVDQISGKIITDWEHENKDYNAIFADATESTDSGYDPRRRGWYKAAVETGDIVWSDVYTFASDQQLGLTAALPVYDARGRVFGVFGVDIGLLEFSNFLDGLDLGERGHAFVVEKESQEFLAVSLPEHKAANDLYFPTDESGEQEIKRLTLETTHSPYYRRAYEAYVNGKTIKETSDPLFRFFLFLLGNLHTEDALLENYNFSYESNDYLVTIRDISPAAIGRTWQLGLILNTDDFMSGVNQNSTVIIIFSVLLILIVGFVGASIASRISKPIIQLAEEMDNVRNLHLLSVSKRKNSRIQEIQNMNMSFDSMLNGLLSFRKYVPADLVTQLIRVQGSPAIGGERKEITLLFSDIRDFTNLSERLPPEELLDKLEMYFDMFSTILLQSHATIDKYIGDAIMAFWGAPLDVQKHAIHACHAAVQFIRELRKSELADIFYTRIGIHTGTPLVGNVGSSKRLNYTAIGDAVNLTSRLENLNKYYGSSIIVSEKTLQELGDSFEVRFLDFVAVQGKHEGMKIYELLGDKGTFDLLQTPGEEPQKLQQFLSLYNLGTRYYLERNWSKAVHYFARAYELRKSDKSAKLMYLRCYNFYQKPPSDDWDGVISFREK